MQPGYAQADRTRAHPHPGAYPGASAPQAWSASAIVLLVNAMLGIVPLAPIGAVVVDPCLPEWLPDVALAGVRVGGARLAIGFRRDATGRTLHRVDENSGGLNVLRPRQTGESAGEPDAPIAAALAEATARAGR